MAMTLKQRYNAAVSLLRQLRSESRDTCDVVFVSPSWESKHAAHSLVISLSSPKLAQDLRQLRGLGESEKQQGIDKAEKELIIDVPTDVSQEGWCRQ